jgi:hypothetical protein
VQLACFGLADFGEHAAEVVLRIEAMAVGAGEQGVEAGVAVACVVVAGEEPVFSAQGDRFHRALGGVIVDVQIAFFAVAIECIPLDLHVLHRQRDGASRQHELFFRVKPGVDFQAMYRV